MDDRLAIKKKIMFIKEEDYYFLTYNLLILLDVFKCHNEKTGFKFYQKIAYLIDFISYTHIAYSCVKEPPIPGNGSHCSGKNEPPLCLQSHQLCWQPCSLSYI